MAKSTLPPHKLSAASKAMVKKVLAFIRKHDNFLDLGHVRSDGDALGSAARVPHLLKKLGKKSQVGLRPGRAARLPLPAGQRRGRAGPEDLKKGYSAVFTFDSDPGSGSERHLGARAAAEELTVVNVDLTRSNERFGDINWVDPRFSACGEMVWELVKAAGVKPDKNIATVRLHDRSSRTRAVLVLEHDDGDPPERGGAAAVTACGPARSTRRCSGRRRRSKLRLPARGAGAGIR
jgi:hypothetical protein